MIDLHRVNDLTAKARRAIETNDHTDAGWDRAERAIDRVIAASDDPTGLAPEVLEDFANIHQELTSCDCRVCKAVAS